MRDPLKSLGMLTILAAALAASGPALAQAQLAAIGRSVAGPVTAPRALPSTIQAPVRAEPVSLAARQAVAAAPFAKPHRRGLDLTVRGDDRLKDQVELREKEAWNEDEGFQLKATKVAYTRRF